jgi:hypothetical protein
MAAAPNGNVYAGVYNGDIYKGEPYVNVQVKAQDNIDFGALQKSSLNAATPAVTVSDKTGFSLSTAGVQAVWDALTSVLTTVGSVGKRIADYLDAAISSRSTYAGADTAGTTTLLSRIVGTLLTGNHSPQSGDSYPIVNNVTYGNSALHTEVAKDSTVMKAAGYTAPDNTSVAAVKVQTDKLAFTATGKVDSNVLMLNGDATAAANLAKSASVIYQAA